MGSYAFIKMVLKVKEEYKEPIKDFINVLSKKGYNCSTKVYSDFWESIGISPFENMHSIFSRGSVHAYTTPFGCSDDHVGSFFYDDDYAVKSLPRFKEDFLFLEHSLKLSQDTFSFIENVVPLISNGYAIAVGFEGATVPSVYFKKLSTMYSKDDQENMLFNTFLNELKDMFKEEEDDGRLFG